MKTTISSKGLMKSISVVLMVTLILSFTSCSQKIPFAISSVVPATEGSIKIKEDKNNNYTIKLEVVRLVDPSRLTPTKAGYIVWMQTEKSGIQKIGQLISSSGFMSNKQKGSLTTVTSFKPTRFFITGEDNLSGQYPGEVILETNFFSVK
ncbi:MAG: hypothetical protein JNM78_05075 [Cyclobacteriaceae bacterium]|nr:hypothetical protein [Cyclobacteriaceae bacterium]